MKKNNKGFTLAELLIVVAIIAVLVAIAIPVFSTQLEKSREATDVANVRSAYAGLMTDYITDPASAANMSAVVSAKQAQTGWQTSPAPVLEGMNGASMYDIAIDANGAKNGGKWTLTIDTSGTVSIKGE